MNVSACEQHRDARRAGTDVIALGELEREVLHVAQGLPDVQAGPAGEGEEAELIVGGVLVMTDDGVQPAAARVIRAV
jgi:hypothetical protein